MFRIYKSFASTAYKIIMLILYPIAAAAGCYLIQNQLFGFLDIPRGAYGLSAILLNGAIIFFEVISDFPIFGGITSKNAAHIVFFKTAPNGKLFFQKALIADLLRRILMIAGCNIINILIGVFIFGNILTSENIIYITNIAFSAFLFSELLILFCRFFEVIWVNATTSYFVILIYALAAANTGRTLFSSIVSTCIYFVLGFTAVVFSIRLAIKKLEVEK